MNPADERISTWQLAAILFLGRAVTITAIVPTLSLGEALPDAWLGSLLSGLLFIPVGGVWLALAGRFPHRDVVRMGERIFGPFLGRVLGLGYLWGFLHIAAVVLRQYGEVLATAIIPETPLVFTMGMMIFAAAVATRAGIEVIGRLAELTFVFFSGALALTWALSVPLVDLARLLPVLGRGIEPVLPGALASAALFGEMLPFLVLAGHLARPRAAPLALGGAILGNTLVSVLAALIVVGALGPREGARQAFPTFAVARLVLLGQFMERIEAAIVLAWGFGLFVQLASLYYAGARSLAEWLGLQDYRPFVFPMGAILLVLALRLFDNFSQLLGFFAPRHLAPYAFLLIAGLPVVYLGAAWLRGVDGLGEAQGR